MQGSKAKILIVFVTILLLGLSVYFKQHSLPGKSAVIVDQLFEENTDFGFVERACGLLNENGYDVVVFRGEEVTLGLFYDTDWDMDIIVLRMHSGVFDNRTWLFTHEEYDPSMHVIEQLSRDVNIGRCESIDYPVFTLSSSFFRRNIMFHGGLVIVMGCIGLDEADLGIALVESGAGIVVGWNGAITVEETDEAVTAFLERILKGGTVGEAVDKTGLVFYPDYSDSFKLG